MTKSPKPQPLDDETAAALTLYNTYLVADREQQAHERALRKAEKAKDHAAAEVRKLNDRKAPAAKTAEAEAKYRDAAEALRRLRDGGTTARQGSDEEAADPAGDAEPDNPEAASDNPEAEPTTVDGEDDSSAGVEASVGDDDLAGDEPASRDGHEARR